MDGRTGRKEGYGGFRLYGRFFISLLSAYLLSPLQIANLHTGDGTAWGADISAPKGRAEQEYDTI
jgi:hypothetical protein